MSPHTKIQWPISVSLQHCANKSSRELIEILMRKYQWRECTPATEHQATLLWTDQKFARSYKSFRMVAQNSAWINAGGQQQQQLLLQQQQAQGNAKVEKNKQGAKNQQQTTAGSPTHASQPGSSGNSHNSGPPVCEFFPDRSAVRFTNHLPDLHALVTKAALAQSLSWYSQLFPAQYDFAPRSWDLAIQGEMKAFQEKLEENKEKQHGGGAHAQQQSAAALKTYIIKPYAGRQGDGIVLIQKYSELLALLSANPGRHYVASEYIADPLLLDGFKFDCRVYVLIESLQPFRAYLLKDGLARLATAKYHPPTSQNLSQQYMHLTNYSLNKSNTEQFQHEAPERKGEGWDCWEDENNLAALSSNSASKRSIRTALLQLRLQGVPLQLDDFWRETSEIVQKTLLCMWPSLQGSYNRLFPDVHNVDTISSGGPGTGAVKIQQGGGGVNSSAQHPSPTPSPPVPIASPTAHALSRGSTSSTLPSSSPSPLSSAASSLRSSASLSSDASNSEHEHEAADSGSGSDEAERSDDDECEDHDDDRSDSGSSSDNSPRHRVGGGSGGGGGKNVDQLKRKPSVVEQGKTNGMQQHAAKGAAVKTSAKPPMHPGTSSKRSSVNQAPANPTPSSPSPSSASPITSYPFPPAPPSLLTPATPSHCFHLIGFDIILDSNLKPWLLEVNAAPSLNLDSSIDKRIKLAVLERSFELMGFIPPGGANSAFGPNGAASVPLFDPSKDLA